MAHLQAKGFTPQRHLPRQIRLTAIRAFMPKIDRLSGRQVREMWQRRFRDKGPGHPYWLYTHIPFCPQICTFCQCSTSLRKSDQQIDAYLEWLEGELDWLASSSESGLVRFQYIGGGTPNLLSEPQLQRLLERINRNFHFDTESRRTFEFLPSDLRPETLPLVRAHGFNRLSCGIQSWSKETLKAVNRSQDGLDVFARTIQSAYALGFNEFNVDLIHGIGRESREGFLESLLHVLSVNPTTVTIHHVIPTATNPVFASVAEELAAFAIFENLQHSIGEAVAREYPHMQWVLRPNSWILADRRFLNSGDFSLWYYSDNERIHIDMLSAGRFAHSNMLGQVVYENLSQATRYDPDEPSYHAFLKTPAIDAALDVITDLVGDKQSDLAPIAERYGVDAMVPLYAALSRLRDEGIVAEEDGRWRALSTEGVFIDPFLPVLDAALQGIDPPWRAPAGKVLDNAIRIGSGNRTLLAFIETIHPDKRYFAQMGRLGIFYRTDKTQQAADDEVWIEELMADFLDQVRLLLDKAPNITPKAALARLKSRLSDLA